MRSALLLALFLMVLAGLGGLLVLRRGGPDLEVPAPGAATPSYWPGRVAANGVVEGARPEIALRLELTGVLAAVHAREDEDVKRGALLAELHNETQKQDVALATAEVAIARADLDRLRNGERAERRKAIAAAEQAKRAMFQQAKADWDRSQRLVENRSASREQVDRDYFTMLRVQAEWNEAEAELALVEAPARAEEVAAAEARVVAAEARQRLAEAALAKTRLLAPGDGRVLRVYPEPGELAGPTTENPVLLLADLSKRRVRAFVEELDAARVKVGQRATVTADGLPDREFQGTLSLVMPRLGRRSPQSDTPGEYKDIYFREVLIDLEAADELPLNLRVHVLIQVEPAEHEP